MLRCLAWAAAVATLPAQVVPAPRSFESFDGEVRVTAIRCVDEELKAQAAALVDGLHRLGARAVALGDAPAGPGLTIELGWLGHGERYRIERRDGGLVLSVGSPRGAARGAASLLQLVQVADGAAVWPAVEVDDAPDLPFRCFMVDMGRNPHPPAVLRQVVDALWFYKVGYLHLHLSDDQLFSWPSRAFPKLYSERAGWTRDDFVELEAYSQARGVTIIPELDVPGHSSILRREYPEVFGKDPTELATRPEAQRGLERLFDELFEVFAATPYLHLGGDEAYGVPGDAQRVFLNRLDRFVQSRHRRSIVWEGPRLGDGEHKVATDVIHMNWRTVDFPAQQMLDAGYQVINAAWDPLYIVDHYPRTMFTAVAVERCYAWDLQRFAHVNHDMPTFARPHRTTTSDGILGFCMPWWEGRPENLLGLCVPRLAAVGAAAWHREGEDDFADFQRRQVEQLARFQRLAAATLPELPFAEPATQQGNLAYRAVVTVSAGASQPVFGPARLTNGITDRFDHFLGYPTQPEPLRITIDLGQAVSVGRVVVHETAVGQSHEIYQLLVSLDGEQFVLVGAAGEGTRGDRSFVEHGFEPRQVRFLEIRTSGCHGLTFPSFSRLCEVMAFAR